MPKDAPLIKIQATKSYGGNVILFDRFTEDWEVISQKLCAEQGLTNVHPYNTFDVIAGAGTVAKELIEEVG